MYEYALARAHEPQDVAADFLDEIGIGRLCGQQRDIARELGAHGLEAPDFELHGSGAGNQSGTGLETVTAMECMIGEVSGEPEAAKQNRIMPRPGAPIMVWVSTQHLCSRVFDLEHAKV